jgi:acyl-CoA thioester hydrolase
MAVSDEFVYDFEVRDSECDLIGVVNNSIYLQYMEHARHQFLKKHLNISFSNLAEKKVYLIIFKAELLFKNPLRSGDEFTVTTKMERVSTVKFQFIQDIHRKSDQVLCCKGTVVGTAMNHVGMPVMPDDLLEIVPELKFLFQD